MVRHTDFRALDRQELEAEVVAERRRLDVGEARWLAMLGVLDDRRREDASVAESLTAWLARHCRLGHGQAAGKVALARTLAKAPVTAAALAAGDVSPAQARALAEAQRAHPEAFAAHEGTLVEAARRLSVRKLRVAIAYWRQNLDYQSALADGEARYRRRRLHVSPTFGGMVRIDGDADPESGATIMTALEAADGGATDPDDGRSPAQRRLDALVKVCRHYLDAAGAPDQGGDRPHLTVLVDLAALERRAGRRCETDRAGVIHPEAARRLACDAGISRVITSGDSMPLDVGRRTRVVSPAQRRALVVRDGACRYDGCEEASRFCDAHHLVHWVDGGATDLDNLVLLCRRHHRAVHEGAALGGKDPPLAA